jgi:polysaccharide export outer membrane protein
MRILVVLLTLLMSAGVVVAQSAPGTHPDPVGPLLGPGDALRITVLRHPELSGEFAVTSDGTLLHPLYRDLYVAGVSLSEVDTMMRSVLARFEVTPEFVLDPLFQVAVSGEVRQPSLYALRPSTTIAQAVALAGGATERGRLDRVRLFRRGDEHVIDLSGANPGMGMQNIQSGDQILVVRRTQVFRDYIAPASSIVAALAGIFSIILR